MKWLISNLIFLLFAYSIGERELVEFLNEEITTEKQSAKKIPTELDGFKVTYDGSNVELVKQTDKEKYATDEYE